MDATNHDDVMNSTTNWRLAGGSLTDSISFESSFSTTTANHESDDGITPAVVDHVTKSPLLLLPPTPDGEPCEITITFAQEHELRQIYIRSTARVYEVYYTKKPRDDKEYLCTVRCGVAMREEEVLQIIPPTESAASNSRVEPVKDDDPMERKVKDNGNGRTNEDDWIEVKSGDDSLLNNEKDLFSVPQLGQQDFFEATAEIDDAEPCISITLRLLSLQDKRCALVDEVYVFADPVDPSESEKEEASGTGNSSSSALMAMFMPTLLQLSRGKDVRKEQERKISEKSNCTNPGSLGNSNDSDKIVNEIQQETNFSKPDHAGLSSPVLVDTSAKQVGGATGASGAEIKPAISCSNVETILHHLVNKVSRIETILTRFEDQMMKPIYSIDARLQLVEKKLEHLGKKPFESELLVETKTSNPNSLGSETGKPPETDDLEGLTKGRDNPLLVSCTKTVVTDSSSIDKSEDFAVVQPKNTLGNNLTKFVEPGSENNSISGNEMISAESEISDKEVGHSLGRESFEESPKRSLSINDALASALAGLLSSTSITEGKYTQALVVTAPEFSNEDEVEMEEKPPSGSHPDKSQVAAELGNTYCASERPTSSQKEPEITLCIEDDSQETSNGVSVKLGDSVGGYADVETVISVRDNDLDEETVSSRTKADCYTEREKLSYEPNPDSLIQELEHPNVTTECGSSRFFATKESKEEPEMDNVLKSILGFQPTTSSVDFLTPVLDVKFSSEKKVSDGKCFFEALFTEESKNVVDCDDKASGDNDLVSVEDEELKGPPTDTLSSLEMDHYETNEMQLQLNADISTASLI